MFEKYRTESGLMGVLILTATGYEQLVGLSVDHPVRYDKRVIEEVMKYCNGLEDHDLRPLIESLGYDPALGLKIRFDGPIYTRYFCLSGVPFGDYFRIRTECYDDIYYESIDVLYDDEWILARP